MAPRDTRFTRKSRRVFFLLVSFFLLIYFILFFISFEFCCFCCLVDVSLCVRWKGSVVVLSLLLIIMYIEFGCWSFLFGLFCFYFNRISFFYSTLTLVSAPFCVVACCPFFIRLCVCVCATVADDDEAFCAACCLLFAVTGFRPFNFDVFSSLYP